MNEDEILSQFRKPPRTEFAQSLYERLSKGEEMYTGTLNGAYPSKRTSWDWRLTLVAGLVMVMSGVVAIGLYQPSGKSTPSITITPLLSQTPITRANADQIEHLTELGKGHASAAIWSPDGKYIAVTGTLGVWMYDAADLSQPLYLIEKRNTYISASSFSQDGSKFAFSTLDGVTIWDMNTREDVTPEFEKEPSSGSSFAFSPDASLLAIGDYQGLITIYDTVTGALKSKIEVFFQYTPIFGLDFSRDGKRLVFSTSSSPILVIEDSTGEWENWDGEPVAFRPSESSEAITWGGSFNPDGTQLAARVGNFVVIFDAITGEEIKKFDTTQQLEGIPSVGGGGGGTVKGGGGDLTFSPDGQEIITVDETVRVWDIATGTGRTLITPDETTKFTIGTVNFSPDWTTLSTVGYDGIVHFIDIASSEEVAAISDYTMSNISNVAFSPDGMYLASANDSTGLHLWDIQDLDTVPSPIRIPQKGMSSYGLQRTAFSPDGSTMATYSETGEIQLIDTATGEEKGVWSPPEHNITGFGFSGFIDYNADGTRLISTTPDAALIWVWDTAKGEVIQTIPLEQKGLSTAVFSPDGSKIAVGLGAAMYLGMGGEQPPEQISIAIYDVETGQIEKTLTGEHHDIVRSIKFNKTGSKLISVGNDGKVVLWDVENGQAIRDVQATNASLGLQFSADDSLILTIEWADHNSGGIVNLWDTETGELVASLEHETGIQTLDMSNDGSLIVTGAIDGTIHIWGIR